jgi:hypothetical protein
MKDNLGSLATPRVGVLPMLLGVAILSGCGSIREQLRKGNEGIVAAIPIEETTYGKDPMKAALDDPTTRSRNMMIGNMAVDSATKCAIFVNGLGSTGRITDSFFDILTTTLAGLGAILTPVNTVRALSGAAAISSGTKTALDADVFGQKTAPAIVGQININYAKALKEVVQKSKDDNIGWPPPLAASEMITAHNQCSLDAALFSLNTALGKSQAQEEMLNKLFDAVKKSPEVKAQIKAGQ